MKVRKENDCQDFPRITIESRGSRDRLRVVPMRVYVAGPGVFVQRCKGE